MWRDQRAHPRSRPAPESVRSRPVALELHKIYPVVPDSDAAQDGDLRIIDESGEDYLYSADRFIAIDVPKSLERAMLKRAS